jgi:ApaG protein
MPLIFNVVSNYRLRKRLVAAMQSRLPRRSLSNGVGRPSGTRVNGAGVARGSEHRCLPQHCRIARMYRAVTRNIEVVVTPRFVADRSSPENSYFFWAYTISITNQGDETVQLKTRHWRITDAHGRRQEVRGAGVVGEEPVLKAGESFEYTSGVPLQTPSGFMTGTYGMVTAGGELFDIEIPAFSLDSGDGKRTIN